MVHLENLLKIVTCVKPLKRNQVNTLFHAVLYQYIVADIFTKGDHESVIDKEIQKTSIMSLNPDYQSLMSVFRARCLIPYG
jgi:type III secretory pathway component EscT